MDFDALEALFKLGLIGLLALTGAVFWAVVIATVTARWIAAGGG